jgi:DNA-binding transcriptional MerR regulator
MTAITADLTIAQLARRTGLAESALRYYERIGLIAPVPRDHSSGHRRYSPDLVTAVEALACLRDTGMTVAGMRTYVDNMRTRDAADQLRLFSAHAQRLGADIERLQVRHRYVSLKAALWAARDRGDHAAEQALLPDLIALSERLLHP